MLILILCSGTWPGPSIITWQPLFHAICVSSPSVSSSANCARSLASAIEPGRRPSPERERHVIFPHQVADLVEMGVEEALLVMRQAPLRHDRAAARDDAGDAVGGEVDVGQPHAGVDREIVDALFALLDQRVLVELPGQLDGIAVAFLQRLVDRHGADRDRRVAQNPFAGGVDVAARWRGPSRCRRPSGSPTPSCRLLPPPTRSPRSCRYWR